MMKMIKNYMQGDHMRIKEILSLLLLFLVLINTGSIYAQEEETEASPNQQAVYIDAENLKYEEEKTILGGGVTIRKNETTITARDAELIRETQKMFLENSISVDYPDGKVFSDKLEAMLETEEYIFTENVRLEYDLSEEGKNMLLNSEYLRIFGDDKSFVAEDNVVIDYDNQKFRGDDAEYDGASELLVLTNNVEIEEGDDWVKSDKATFNLAEGEEGYTAEGNVRIKMILN